MKTLIYTSIYSNLYGTKFGGRPSRNLHYKYSLLNILNLNADKFICFTSQEEIEDLKHWFYIENNISEQTLELIAFDLKNSKYFEKIDTLKDLDVMQTLDRCYEIQYNKFFWLDNITELDEYSKVYWFDAGLSHGGLFPSKYSTGEGYGRDFSFSLFNSSFLKYLNGLTKEKPVLVTKNNTGRYYWSTSLPASYYKDYNNSKHVIGGFFGGNIKDILNLKNNFEILLLETFKKGELYFEELIMSCMYQNNRSNYLTLDFDDWYDRDIPEFYREGIKYFYSMFEINKKQPTCITSIAIEITENGTRYLEAAKRLIETNLTYTDFDILILTNYTEYFKEFTDSRLKVIDYNTNYKEPITSSNRFNMHLKRYCIELASKLNYEIIYFNDCDCYITNWDQKSFEDKCAEDFDVAFVNNANPQLGDLRKVYPRFQDIIDTEFQDLYYDALDQAPNPAETRVIFKNNEKLEQFLSFWSKISAKNQNYFTYHDGIYFGTSAIHAKMKMTGVTEEEKFTEYCRVDHNTKILNHAGTTLEEKLLEVNTTSTVTTSENSNSISGAFYYKGLQVLQHSNVRSTFRELLSTLRPVRIVEIGTEMGGLSLILHDLILELELERTLIRTYDIKDCEFIKTHKDKTSILEVINRDLFNYYPLSLKPYSVVELTDFLDVDGSTLVLCDGGNKIEEFKVMSDFIKEGDVIMAHDYAKDEKTFKEEVYNKIWNWFEIQEADIEEAIKKNNLKPYMEQEFEKVAWTCKIK